MVKAKHIVSGCRNPSGDNMNDYGPSTFEKGSLRDQLKSGTREVHGVADKLFTQNFVKDVMDRATYRHFLSQLYFLYEAMEAELRRNETHPVVGPVHFPDELERVAAIEEDLAYYYGPAWRSEISCLPSMRRYVERVRKVGREQPELLIAHAYVRYLGDVSGGQIIKRIIGRLFTLPADGSGIAFFEFGRMESIAKFKEFYNGRMNALELDDETVTALVDEAKLSFQFSVNVFSEVIDAAAKRRTEAVDANGQTDVTTSSSEGVSNRTAMLAMASLVVTLSATMLGFCPWFTREIL